MHTCSRAAVLVAIAGLTASGARAADPPSGPAPKNARLYADCLADAAASDSIQRQGRYLLFTCKGGAAERFFDRLGERKPGSAYAETRADGLYRFTETPKKNTDGLDYCRQSSTTAAPPETICVLIYPAGPFLDQ
jgi:hypothetical protein